MRNCIVDGCSKRPIAKGFCKRHYQQQWRTGTPAIVRANPHGTPEERFWRYVDKRGPDECWPWNGRCDKDHYGTLRFARTMIRAHRFSYQLHFGAPPEQELVRHKCNNPPCVNPKHLVLGSHLANMADRASSGNYPVGEKHAMAKISDATAAEIKASPGTHKDIAARFGISASQVSNIKRGKRAL